MTNKTRTIIALLGTLGSLFVLTVGLIRLLTESLSSTPLFVAYIFVITGFIGFVGNAVSLRKSQSN